MQLKLVIVLILQANREQITKNKKVAKYIDEQRKRVIDEGVLSANELLHILSNAAVGDESEVRGLSLNVVSFNAIPILTE